MSLLMGSCCGCSNPCLCDCTLTDCWGSRFNGGKALLKSRRVLLPDDECFPEAPPILNGFDEDGWFWRGGIRQNSCPPGPTQAACLDAIYGVGGWFYNTGPGGIPYYANAPGQGLCASICWRLSIYHCAYHNGTRYFVDEACRTDVRTSDNAYLGPHNQDGSNSGPLLTAEPFWWDLCGDADADVWETLPHGIGGWAVISDWWVPTAANLTTVYNKIVADIGSGNMPASGETHTLIIYTVRDRKLSCCEEDSRIRLLAVHLTCPGLN